MALSVGLGFVNEYWAEKAAEALHSQSRHQTVVVRDGRRSLTDVVDLVPGHVVDLKLGDLVPADIRLLHVTGMEADEAILTGESAPVEKPPRRSRRMHHWQNSPVVIAAGRGVQQPGSRVARRMSRCKVLVKRLVCIEDLGDVDVLFTDKTGTLTLGRIDYASHSHRWQQP